MVNFPCYDCISIKVDFQGKFLLEALIIDGYDERTQKFAEVQSQERMFIDLTSIKKNCQHFQSYSHTKIFLNQFIVFLYLYFVFIFLYLSFYTYLNLVFVLCILLSPAFRLLTESCGADIPGYLYFCICLFVLRILYLYFVFFFLLPLGNSPSLVVPIYQVIISNVDLYLF